MAAPVAWAAAEEVADVPCANDAEEELDPAAPVRLAEVMSVVEGLLDGDAADPAAPTEEAATREELILDPVTRTGCDVTAAGSEVTADGRDVTTVGWEVTTDGMPVMTPREFVCVRYDVNGLL